MQSRFECPLGKAIMQHDILRTYHVDKGISNFLGAVPGTEALVQLLQESLVYSQYRWHHVEDLVH